MGDELRDRIAEALVAETESEGEWRAWALAEADAVLPVVEREVQRAIALAVVASPATPAHAYGLMPEDVCEDLTVDGLLSQGRDGLALTDKGWVVLWRLAGTGEA